MLRGKTPRGGRQLKAATEDRPKGLALDIRGLSKVYGRAVQALDQVSLAVRPGEVFGLLGPNGAGKSTLIKATLTLTKATSGTVTVMGVDTVRQRSKARAMMGYVPQEVSVDGDLSGYENLLIFAKLYKVDPKSRKARIEGALGAMGLKQRADDLVKTYSGGMMRRLELAQAIVNEPKVLFLDEPSIGLDPIAKREVWRLIREMKDKSSTTILITTHDMAEAEELCDRVAIIDEGKVIVSGTPDELRSLVGGEVVVVKMHGPPDTGVLSALNFPPEIGASVLRKEQEERAEDIGNEVSIVVKTRAEDAALRVARTFEAAGVQVESISFSKPTLDDVFLKFTQRRIEEAETFKQTRSARRNFKRHAR